MRKLWRLGFQASLDEVVTVGAAVQYLLAERVRGGAAYVVGSQALVDHVAEAGLRIVNRTRVRHARRRRRGRRPRRLRLRGAQDRHPGRDPRRRADRRRRATPSFPMPDGPWPGTGAVLAAIETAAGPQAATGSSASPSRRCTTPPATGSATGRMLAVGDRLDDRRRAAPARAGLDSALVLTGGATSRPQAEAAPSRGHARRRLARGARARGRGLASGRMDGPVCLIVNPHAGAGRAAAAAARRRGRAARAGASRFRVERTTSMDHARELAREAAAQRARSWRRWAATGSPARSRASCATATALLAVLPGGRGNDFARKLGIPSDPVAACEAAADGARAADRPRRGRRHDLPRASSAPAWTPTSTGSRTRRG